MQVCGLFEDRTHAGQCTLVVAHVLSRHMCYSKEVSGVAVFLDSSRIDFYSRVGLNLKSTAYSVVEGDSTWQ